LAGEEGVTNFLKRNRGVRGRGGSRLLEESKKNKGGVLNIHERHKGTRAGGGGGGGKGPHTIRILKENAIHSMLQSKGRNDP